MILQDPSTADHHLQIRLRETQNSLCPLRDQKSLRRDSWLRILTDVIVVPKAPSRDSRPRHSPEVPNIRKALAPSNQSSASFAAAAAICWRYVCERSDTCRHNHRDVIPTRQPPVVGVVVIRGHVIENIQLSLLSGLGGARRWQPHVVRSRLARRQFNNPLDARVDLN